MKWITLYWVFLPGFKNGALIPTTSDLDTLEKCCRISLIPIISPTHSSYPLSCRPICNLSNEIFCVNSNINVIDSIWCEVYHNLRDCFRSNFMAAVGELLDHLVVAVLVRNEESAFNIATVRIFTFSVEDLLVVFEIVQIDCSVEREKNHLGHLKKIFYFHITSKHFRDLKRTSSGSRPPGISVPSLEQKQ